ncbi:LysR family transcriptional regulator [Rhizobium sp. Td3]|nr:LysR family transcriptional regulator [Rhizobium sp. RM]TMV20826.1 LysR family transcriptional regulator [Rhizobium sp. Td3]
MHDLQIDWLRAFIAVVDSGSITAASRQVSRSQSAVSMQLKKLEDCVGHTLLDRGPRTLSLTPAGIDLLSYARQLTELHGRAQLAMRGATISGKVSIGVPDDYISSHFALMLRSLATRFTDVEITVVCEPSSSLLPRIDRGDLDVALVTRDTAARGEPDRGRFLFHEPLVWVASDQHEAWRRDPLPLALHELGNRFRNEVLAGIEALGRDYRVVYGSPNITGQLAIVEAGLAVAAVARCSAPAHLKLLDTRHGLPDLPKMEVALVRSRDSRRSAAVEAIYNEVLQTLDAQA